MVEFHDDEREEDWSDLTPPTPEQSATRSALIEAEKRERYEYAADPESWIASGRLPPWDAMEPVLSAEERLIQADFVDDSDPVGFDHHDGLFVAQVLLDGFFVPLLRVALPDGTLAAVTDQEAEETKILALHGDDARQRKIAFALREEGIGEHSA